MPKKNGKKESVDVGAEIHQLVGRVHRLKIQMGQSINSATIERYQKECDEKEAMLNKLSEKHQDLISKELAALDYVPK